MFQISIAGTWSAAIVSILVSCNSTPKQANDSGVLGARVQLDMYIASPDRSIEFTRCIKLPNHPNHPDIWATEAPVLSETDIERVYWTHSSVGQRSLGIDMTEAGAATLKRTTEMYMRKFIVMELDGKVVFAPLIMGVLSKRVIISVDEEDVELLDAFARSMGAQRFDQMVPGKELRRPVLE